MQNFLETDRLILRLPEPKDLKHLLLLRSDADVMKYIGQGTIQTQVEVESFLNIAIDYQEKHGFGFCCVFEKETGYFVGQAGLFHIGFHEEQPEIEVACRLHKAYWGKGYGTELARTLIRWGFTHLSVKKLVALVHPENIHSQHILEKLGMISLGKIRHYDGQELLRYEIYKEDAVELVPYDNQWPTMAKLEIETLRSALPKSHVLDIQHVGSTAIPGIHAKPIIDLQIAVDSLIAIKAIVIDALEKLGYQYWAENPDPGRMFFVKGMPPFGEKRTHHVHIVEPASKHWQGKIQFRDYLLFHPAVAHEYDALKMKLAAESTYDREKYTEAKTQFVNEVLQKANFLPNAKLPFVIFLTGASGAGKTTLLDAFSNIPLESTICLHFDSIGVPSEDEMIKTYGSGSEWQKAMTYYWVQRIIQDYSNKTNVILEGQVNLDFIASAFAGFNFHSYQIILFHCDDLVRHQRLHQGRNQSELINETMDNWAAFLKKQAIDRKAVILDTTSMSIDEMLERFKNYVIKILTS